MKIPVIFASEILAWPQIALLLNKVKRIFIAFEAARKHTSLLTKPNSWLSLPPAISVILPPFYVLFVSNVLDDFLEENRKTATLRHITSAKENLVPTWRVGRCWIAWRTVLRMRPRHLHVKVEQYLSHPHNRPNIFRNFKPYKHENPYRVRFNDCIERELWPALWSSVQRSYIQTGRPMFYSRRYQMFWVVLGLVCGPLSLVGINKLLPKR